MILDGHAPIDADEILWTTQAAPARWLGETGLPLDDNGFLRVDETLRVAGHDEIFAAGDTISFPTRALPKSGVYAVRAGPVLADNISRTLTGRRLRAVQAAARSPLSGVHRQAPRLRYAQRAHGRWRLGVAVEGLDRPPLYGQVQQAARDAAAATQSPRRLRTRGALKDISAIAMRCGGCGAKVGATVLTRALGAIEPQPRSDVILGLDSPDDAAVVDTGGERLSVQSVDYFRAIVDDPYMFGKIAANHALGDIYAMGGEPQSALAIATVPYGLEQKVEADLSAMMAGANAILREAGCALVGGHTSEGAELALGFAVNGLVARDLVTRKDGLRPGDALILTKPIGTGTLLAADMRGKAKARWVMNAIAHMVQSNRTAAEILRRYKVHAVTDVTGFGVIGHLVEMVRASDVDVTVAPDRVPLLDGARASVALGIFSSLQPQNVRLRRAVANLDTRGQASALSLVVRPADGRRSACGGSAGDGCAVRRRTAGSRLQRSEHHRNCRAARNGAGADHHRLRRHAARGNRGARDVTSDID